MIDNPYTKFIGMMREEGSARNPTTFIIGLVVNENPLKIKVDEIEADRSELLINDMLQNLKKGDKILILPSADNQQFIVVCRLV